jgi:hypothetical protein
MTNALVPVRNLSSLTVPISPQDQVSILLSATFPRLLVDRANLPTAAKQLADHLARAGYLLERGTQVVRIVDTHEGRGHRRAQPDAPSRAATVARRYSNSIAQVWPPTAPRRLRRSPSKLWVPSG